MSEPVIVVESAWRPADGPPPLPPGAARSRVELSDDEWIAAMSEEGTRTSVYLDSAGRQVRVVHPGLVPPAAIIFHDGVPAVPVEFLWKGDD